MKSLPSRLPFFFLIFGFPVLLSGCKKETESLNSQKQPITQPKIVVTKDNVFEPMRYMALHVKPKELNLSFPIDKTIVYGMVMDWNSNGLTATTVAFQTGDASMYFSNGKAIIGGSTHKTINTQSKLWVAMAQDYLNQAKQTTETPLPGTETVAFYFVTNWGNFVATESISNLEDKSSYWLPLFNEANKVIAELRKIDKR